ncbi:hypothetical protein N7481_002528 [Penicillium waksmanii]|uniref:uncharacterized protein n=1 Tax=Penicillium waksmanii TaxID=69791 RepID=UPI0025479EEA|nr:uncharacterized protein N7481_002528 [Penicillium waksmanii]KAJ5995551.1 hypothetical protein N7481_002528 [Penicillium waksmanii]
MYKVNVESTKTLIEIAKETGTQLFMYTSSASIIDDGRSDLKNANETFPVILDEKQPDFYVYTKSDIGEHFCDGLSS